MTEENAQSAEQVRPIIIKKIKKGGGGHHGGAWKVAYADFVTAMMAFFLLLWLLNVTTDEAKNAVSSYFDPTSPKISDARSGAGGVLGGLTMSTEGAMASNVQPITTPPLQETTTKLVKKREKPTQEDIANAEQEAEEARFKAAQEAVKKAIESDSQLAALSEHILIDMTPEGLRIQIVDKEGGAMFPTGSAKMPEKTRRLVALIAHVIIKLPNEVSIRGHTDSAPYGVGAFYTNWELSADRANATRMVLLESGLSPWRINNVMGKADKEHLIPQKPLDPQNRRISMILLRQEITRKISKPRPLSEYSSPAMETQGQPVGTFRRTPGAVAFP